MTSQIKPNQKTQDNRYVNQGAEPEKAMGKNLSPEAAKSPSHATGNSDTKNIRQKERGHSA